MAERILIIGEGNVGSHLLTALRQKGIEAKTTSSRGDCYPVANADIAIISVRDDAIPEVAAKLAMTIHDTEHARKSGKPVLVAHTSGSVPLSALTVALPSATPCGVFYPMQTFTKGVAMSYSDIPFLIEGSDEEAASRLTALAKEISDDVTAADSDIRADYHIGAVLTCNFANHLCALADDYLSSKGLEFRTLLPLLRQTLSKLSTTAPRDAQTGPAARGDSKVIEKHLSRIAGNPQISAVYRLLSDSIQASRTTTGIIRK